MGLMSDLLKKKGEEEAQAPECKHVWHLPFNGQGPVLCHHCGLDREDHHLDKRVERGDKLSAEDNARLDARKGIKPAP